jgi:hypothetical protein
MLILSDLDSDASLPRVLNVPPVRLIDYGEWTATAPDRRHLLNPSRNVVLKFAGQAAHDARQLLVIDYELPGLPLDPRKHPASECNKTIDKMIQIADWVHEAYPAVRLGFYGAPLPFREYYPSFKGGKASADWRQANRFAERLVEHVDVVFPSLYTFTANQDDWTAYASSNIAEARRYGRPVLAYLCPQYHPSATGIANQSMPGAFWRLQLELCRDLCDGVVIWGRHEPQSEWWGVTVEAAG